MSETIIIPTSWNDVNVDQFIQLVASDELPNDQKAIARIACLANIDFEEASELSQATAVLADKEMSFLSELPDKQIVDNWNGLVLEMEPHMLPLGAWQDIELAIADNWPASMPKALAVLWREPGPYTRSDKREEIVANMPIPIALGSIDFFFDAVQEYMKLSRHCL